LHCMLGQIYRQEGMVSEAKAEFDRCTALQQTQTANPSRTEPQTQKDVQRRYEPTKRASAGIPQFFSFPSVVETRLANRAISSSAACTCPAYVPRGSNCKYLWYASMLPVGIT
jgi:hypothetical protein